MLTVGMVGWRGMVGSVLIDRMKVENDFQTFQPFFFTTSNVGASTPKELLDLGAQNKFLLDAYNLEALSQCDVVFTCQGADYTKAVFYNLRKFGWSGHWIDAASTLRMAEESILVLDPVNRLVIDQAIENGNKTWCGTNCTVSLMLMAINGLLKHDLVEWVSTMTYQAASGAGAAQVRELLQQMNHIAQSLGSSLDDTECSVLELERRVQQAMLSDNFPKLNFRGVPLACNLIPWIDETWSNGQSKEEWKGGAECNKILGKPAFRTPGSLIVDGICVRVSSLRCHSQGLTIKLNENLNIGEIEYLLQNDQPWVKLIPNDRSLTENELSPVAVSNKLPIAIGRIHKLAMGEQYLGAFTVGDQLLWGAAEPLRRLLQILLKNL